MNDQDFTNSTAMERPLNDDKDAWVAYWIHQGQPWRTEPEIDLKRQKYLEEHRQVIPDMKEGIYPFKDIKLTRADVEWLLKTHEGGRGPVNWNDPSQRTRDGINLCGADLCCVDLRHLPLTRLIAGLSYDLGPSKDERDKAAIRLQGADLRYAHLEGANLIWADLTN
ncbi:MAG TPA: pentapeptide repeat-containing protein, partial [Ktedonobacteraceae bacterium]|nr:pentapeptide repeat-containing protein [Ktedonobacteraceae bacterium]